MFSLSCGEPIPDITCPVSELWSMLEEGAETLSWIKEQVDENHTVRKTGLPMR